MSHTQYEQYKNIHIFATEWRKYTSEVSIMTEDAFRKEMHHKEYVRMDYKNKDKQVFIFLLSVNSKYNNSQHLKKLLASIRSTADIILISKEEFKIYSRRAMELFKNLNIYTYLHEHFNIIVPNGPLCYPHRIMDKKEINNLLNNELYCEINNLPKLRANDPQCIWIGAQPGDVVEVELPSELAGHVIQYRLVV